MTCWWFLFLLLVAPLCCAILSGPTITRFSKTLLVLTSSYQNLRSVYSLILYFPFRSRDIFISLYFLVLLQILVTTVSNWCYLSWGGTVAWWLVYLLKCQSLVLGSQTREMFGLGSLSNILYHMLGWKLISILCLVSDLFWGFLGALFTHSSRSGISSFCADLAPARQRELSSHITHAHTKRFHRITQ